DGCRSLADPGESIPGAGAHVRSRLPAAAAPGRVVRCCRDPRRAPPPGVAAGRPRANPGRDAARPPGWRPVRRGGAVADAFPGSPPFRLAPVRRPEVLPEARRLSDDAGPRGRDLRALGLSSADDPRSALRPVPARDLLGRLGKAPLRGPEGLV